MKQSIWKCTYKIQHLSRIDHFIPLYFEETLGRDVDYLYTRTSDKGNVILDENQSSQ